MYARSVGLKNEAIDIPGYQASFESANERSGSYGYHGLKGLPAAGLGICRRYRA